MNKQSHDIRNGLMCAFTAAAAMWASYPVAETGFLDDWSYIKTAQVFAQTGHFVYNGWAAAMLGWQVVWGALFIRLFGFSFTVVRLSMLPIDIATIFLVHATMARSGVNAQNAVVGTLTVGLSPLFMPMAASYMTDVPGMFVIVLCLYLCQRAVAAGSNKATIAWLCLAAASNVVGGTVRQIAWLGALVMVPSAGWLLRKRCGVLLIMALLWVASMTSIMTCMWWFSRQPYSVPESVLKGVSFNTRLLLRPSINLVGEILCLLLVVFPVLVAWLPEMRRLSRAALIRITWITLAWGMFQWGTGWTMPWIYHVINSEFSASKTGETFSKTHISLPLWGRELIGLLVIATALVLVEQLRSRLWPLMKNRKLQMGSWQDIFWLLGPFTLSYFLLLVPRAYHIMTYDRYLLPIMPIAIIYLLKLHQRWVVEMVPVISIFVLLIFALLAIGGTHDWFAWERARLAAANEVRASGVSRTEIQGGFTYDGWTQIEDGGYINEPQITVPFRAYHPDTRLQQVPNDCKLDFAPFTPAVHPKFSIVFGKMWCLAPSKYPPIHYRTWLPPFSGAIYVQKIPDAVP